MGDLIRFPHRASGPKPTQHDHDSETTDSTTDGTAARVPEPRATPPDTPDTADTEVTGAGPGAELVPDTATRAVARVDRRPVIPPALAAGVRQAARVSWPVTKQAAKAAGPVTKFTARHLYYFGGGLWDTTSNSYARWTGRDIDDRIRAAQAAGEHGVAAELMRQRIESKKIFLERIRVFGQFLVRLPIIIGGLAALTLAITLVVSIVALIRPGGLTFTQVWDALFTSVATGFEWTVWAATVPVPILAVAAVAGVLIKGYNTRRRNEQAPAFLAPAGSAAGEVVITPSVVITALKRSGIAPLRRAIEGMDEHQRAAMISPIHLAGCGVEFDVTLPNSGDTTVTTDEVQERRKKIAEGLGRFEHEVFISPAPSARTVRFWIADPGALDEPIGPSPLVSEEFDAADIYAGRAPWGQTLRGENFLLKLWQCHLLITGMSNQGKTAALRALVVWLLLDPSVEMHLADFKGVGDYNMVKDLVETYIAGPSDDHVIAGTEMLEWGVDEMNRRIQVLEDHADEYPNGITAELSRDPNSGFHPIVLVVDEAQCAFECPAVDGQKHPYGGTKHTSRYFNAARKIHNQGRAVNVTLWQGTQDPTNENLPKRVREGAHIRASLVVGTKSQARMGVGEAAVDSGGAAPHMLRQGKDKGVLVVKDADNTIATVRTHYVDGTDATAIAERARTRRAGVTRRRTEEPAQERDLLADVAAVLAGEDKVRATDVVARLRTLAPGYQPYERLNADKLRTELDALGAQVTKAGVLMVYAERVHQALANREGGNEDE